MVSVGPMLIRIRKTSTLLALCAIEGYRLFPPCSMVGMWNPAVLADGLDVVGRVQVGVGSGDCRELSLTQIRDRLRKLEIRVEVGVMGTAAVPSPPASVESELHDVCKPWLFTGSSRRTARQ